MEQEIFDLLAKELKTYRPQQIKRVLELLLGGNTVPFIARYRKEVTGNLDEVQIREIEERYHYLENLEKRKEEILRLIEEQDKLTPELAAAIKKASKMQQLEDLYRPYKQKRRTKATIAKERGLAPLASWLLSFPKQGDIEKEAANYVNEEKEVPDVATALAGAHEILAEQFGDNATFRTWIRSYTENHGLFVSKVKDAEKDEKGVYEMYYDFSEPVKKMVSHRVLASNRGEKEDILKVAIQVPEEKIMGYFHKQLITNPSVTESAVVAAYEDAYKRFIAPAIEREIRGQLTEMADAQAIAIFGENLRNLLLQPPLKGKVVMGFDPAYRTGCKLAILDATGKVLGISVIYPHAPANASKRAAAKEQFVKLVEQFGVDMVAIGNGTASRESEQFVAEELRRVSREVFYVIVNEAGASVYSASDIARSEFPDLAVEERSAISIGRRLQDPLAELVKIDPKAVGVGQYQHDVSQKRLGEQLDFVVETVVNQVGVDVNTASPQLLQHISGLNKTTAQNILTYREENGAFTTRTQLKKVPRLGPKAYEQAIGFLRIPDGKQVLDNTGIHPESYSVAKSILATAGLKENELGTPIATERLKALDSNSLVQELGVGKATLQDILKALLQPGRDMRDEMPAPLLRKDVLKMEDLIPGMELKGTVRNVIDFGAFVDIGVKQDGLVHISKLSDRFVKHPKDVVAVGDVVTVWVETVDLKKGRIGLTMVEPRKG
ncbi:Tex family protein [Enterococcus asini]|uniref:Tex family protein n=1 Tax=Enterococcus asini TaxID=57732 RepID=UPI00288DBB13|nr:Tex family protein [Enterococcus asini]MDT2763000.1 Tex family protein [Enterococcus asini]